MLAKYDPAIRWFTEARLGLFIHWGLYTATEGFIGDKEVKGIVEWIQSREQVSIREYEKYAQNLSADQFDADFIMELAAQAGMKYMVFTAKHHEGFSMFDTKYDDYGINDRCGVSRDIAGELVAAARKRNIVPCLYYSHGVDMHEPNAMGNTWDFPTAEADRDFDSYFNGKCKFQLRELLTNYGDLGLIWFDVPWGITPERAVELRRFVKELQPNCLINGRLGGRPEDSDFLCMGDNEIPYVRATECAETCATTNDSWGYKRLDKNFKSPQMIIQQLCGLVSKGANLLLNIGPKPDGSIPEEAVAILKRLGRWMQVNGDAIYGTQASVFEGDFSFGWSAWKENRLFLYLKEPVRKITLYGLQNQVLSARTMDGQSIGFTGSPGKLQLDLQGVVFDDCVTVAELTLDGAPKAEEPLYQQESGYVFLPGCSCTIHAHGTEEKPTFASAMDRVLGEWWGNVNTQMKVNINGIIEYWKSEQDYVSWQFRIREPGRYRVTAYTLTGKYAPWQGGHRVRVECDGQVLTKTLTEDVIPQGVNRKYFSETGSHIGILGFQEPGSYCLTIKADQINQKDPAGLSVGYLRLQKMED